MCILSYYESVDKKQKSNWREYFIHGLPLAYLGGFGLGFGQVHFLHPQICCWYVHLEVWVSVVELEVQVPQIFRYSSHLHEIITRGVYSVTAETMTETPHSA